MKGNLRLLKQSCVNEADLDEETCGARLFLRVLIVCVLACCLYVNSTHCTTLLLVLFYVEYFVKYFVLSTRLLIFYELLFLRLYRVDRPMSPRSFYSYLIMSSQLAKKCQNFQLLDINRKI